MCNGSSGGGGGGNQLPWVSCGIPAGTPGSENTGVTQQWGESTVAHGKNIAFRDMVLLLVITVYSDLLFCLYFYLLFLLHIPRVFSGPTEPTL